MVSSAAWALRPASQTSAGLHANVHGEICQVVHGVADELLDRIRALDGLSDPHVVFGRIAAQAYDMSAFKCAADQFLNATGVDLLFHALAVGVVKNASGAIDALIVETKSGRQAIRGRMFIDCSGDGDLADRAGVPMDKGDDDGHLLYPTLMFRVGNIDAARAGDAWQTIPRLMDEAAQRGDYTFPRRGAIVRPMKRAYEWRVNVTQMKNPDGSAVDGTDALSLSNGEIEGRRQVVDYLRFLRERVPGFEHAYALDIAPQLGIRETRRLIAETMLSGDDVVGCADFVDVIGVNGWPLEKHVAGDVVWGWFPDGSRGYNQMPYRMLLPQRTDDVVHGHARERDVARGERDRGDEGDPCPGIDNLLVAGRCAGMTHDGQSAARVSGGCFVMGQAAGTAAAMSLTSGVSPHNVDVRKLQAQLSLQGAFLG
jgi:hypothetical protein